MNERVENLVFESMQPQRLDLFLVMRLPEFSRARLQALIKAGEVLVDGQPAQKAGQVIEIGQQVSVHIPAPVASDVLAEDIPLDVVFENDDLMVVNKPAGMVVHPAIGHSTGTLVNAALGYDPDIAGVGGELRPGVVHRLDKDTSGLILLAKNDIAHRWLQDQFRLRKVNKVYLALVDGFPPTPTGRIEAAIGRSHTGRNQMAITPPGEGRDAVTEYKTLETFTKHTLVEAHPITGRTHQIRLHLRFVGCPVAGDVLYGHKKSSISAGRHFLHATRLTVVLPGEETPHTFEAPLPDELLRVLAELRH